MTPEEAKVIITIVICMTLVVLAMFGSKRDKR